MSLLQCPDVSSSCIFATELIELVSHYEEDSAPRIPRFCRPTSNEVTPVNVRALSLADAVSFLPLPLFCELVLSMRNAAEVLSSLHCDLRRRSALCIVYVCTNQLSALLGEKDRCKCLGDIRLATKRLVACGVQDLWESMYSLLSNRNRDSSKECRPSDDKEDSIDEEYIDTPVVVIEVTGLPRAAAVEVEFVGIGESCRQSPYRSTNRSRNWLSSDVVLLACRNTSIQMHPCWPLLQAAQGPAVHGLYVDWLRGLESLPTVSHSSLAAASVQVTSVGDLLIATNLSCISFDSDIECQEQWVGSEEAFCFGAVTVQVLSSENLQKLLKHVFVMLLSINRMVWEGKVKLEALRCVKFFIPSAFTVISGFIESIPRISQVVLGPVPVTPVLTADNDCCMMSATFIALDLQQLKTDIWMRGD